MELARIHSPLQGSSARPSHFLDAETGFSINVKEKKLFYIYQHNILYNNINIFFSGRQTKTSYRD